MEGDLTLEEFTAVLCEDPEFAAGWAEDVPRIDLGVNVYRLRAAAGLTQLQLAEAAQMKQPRIAEIERGDGNPTLLTITRIALALGVPVHRLLEQTHPLRADPTSPEAGAELAARGNAPEDALTRPSPPSAGNRKTLGRTRA